MMFLLICAMTFLVFREEGLHISLPEPGHYATGLFFIQNDEQKVHKMRFYSPNMQGILMRFRFDFLYHYDYLFPIFKQFDWLMDRSGTSDWLKDRLR